MTAQEKSPGPRWLKCAHEHGSHGTSLSDVLENSRNSQPAADTGRELGDRQRQCRQRLHPVRCSVFSACSLRQENVGN